MQADPAQAQKANMGENPKKYDESVFLVSLCATGSSASDEYAREGGEEGVLFCTLCPTALVPPGVHLK